MSVPSFTWMILTGEYPPQPGGVGDYTHLVARGLVAEGDEVHVWAPPAKGVAVQEDGIHVHRLKDCFGRRGRAELDRALNRSSPVTRVLVQYVPHAFGLKGMNLPFCLWLYRHRGRHQLQVMFHEVAYPWGMHRRFFRHNLLALVTRLMAFLAVRSANRVWVSIPAWKGLLHPSAKARAIEWLPVSSNIPQEVNAEQAADVRRSLLPTARWRLIGHFGTFGENIAAGLRQVVAGILEREEEMLILLIGRGGPEFVAKWEESRPALKGRLRATGELEAREVSEHLTACDILIQPYPDGISSRRGSAMAGLACGRPIVTTRGPLTEPLWGETAAVCLVNTWEEMAERATALLSDENERDRLGRAGAALYRERFEMGRTIAALRSETPARIDR